jgi:hypothetical protein
MQRPAVHRRRLRAVIAVCATVGSAAFAGCGAVPEPITLDAYLSDLQAICASTTEQLLALPAAPEQIAVTDLATSAAGLLDAEATRVGRLETPRGTSADLAADQRAFVRNTQEQADAWRAVATNGPDQLAESTKLIAELVGGRNELADSMGAPACVRGDL